MAVPKVLLADNDCGFLANAQEFLERRGFAVVCACDPQQARQFLERGDIAVALLDYRLLDDGDEHDESGLNLARAVMERVPIPKIILSRVNDRHDYVVKSLKSQKGGRAPAVDFIVKQDGLEKMARAVEEALLRANVFLCYAAPDRASVADLYDQLGSSGLVPWMDHKCINAGEQWQPAIRRAIRACDFFILCLSRNSVNRRGFMQREIRMALEIWEEKLEEDIYLIPVRLEECEITDVRIQVLQWVDLFQPDGYARLLRGIQTGIRRRN